MSSKTKRITALAMFCALAYISVVVGRVPLILFLNYEPKDVILTIGGFIFGAPSVIIMTVIVSFVEMITISADGIIGFVMNVIAAIAFSLPPVYAYKKRRSMLGVAIGLLSGTALMTILMLMWNYCLAPIFMGYPREQVVKLLVPAFLPFNLIKGGVNSAITLLLYKPVMTVLQKTNLIPAQEDEISKESKARKAVIIIVAVFVLISYLILMLSMNRII